MSNTVHTDIDFVSTLSKQTVNTLPLLLLLTEGTDDTLTYKDHVLPTVEIGDR